MRCLLRRVLAVAELRARGLDQGDGVPPVRSPAAAVDSAAVDPTGKRGPRDEGSADPTAPNGRPLLDFDEPGSEDDATQNVSPDAGLVNDPRRVVRPSTASESDPTKNVLPQALVPHNHNVITQPLPDPDAPTNAVSPDPALHNDPQRLVAAEPPPPEARTDPGQGAPTVNVVPDPALHNDPNRILRARADATTDPGQQPSPVLAAPPARQADVPWEEPSRSPTVHVEPDLALINDPMRIVRARQESQRAPTVNVVPDLALHNDPNRILKARAEAQAAPTVNVVPDPAVHNDPNRLLWVREDPPDPPTVNAPPPLEPVPNSGLLWVRDEPETPQTVNTVPSASKITDPDPRMPPPDEPSVITDPDATSTDEPKTRHADFPAEARVLTGAVTPLPPPRPSAARTQVPLGGHTNGDGVVPRPSPAKAPLLDGVAPLKPPPPPAHDPTVRSDPPPPQAHAPLVPLSMLANVEPPPANPDATEKGQRPVEAWRESTAVLEWKDDPRDSTKIMPAAGSAAHRAVRPPRVRDLLVLAVGFVLLCVGMVLARRQTDEGVGPRAAEKIKPPAGYVAPPPPKETAPYVPPDDGRRKFTTVDPSHGSSGSGSGSGGTNAESALASSTGGLITLGGAQAPSTRISLPKCNLNVPAALETQAKWVVEGKKKLLRLRATPKRVAIQRQNLFIASASHADGATIERTENAAVFFEVFLDVEPKGEFARVVLDCECGLATAEVQATINKKSLEVDLKYAKVTPPQVMAAKARKKR